jgi:hypothetical protein
MEIFQLASALARQRRRPKRSRAADFGNKSLVEWVFGIGSLHGFRERHMSTPVSAGVDASRDSGSAAEKPLVISANDARQGPADHELLYVLGFGTTGAIFALAAVLAYFGLFRAWS